VPATATTRAPRLQDLTEEASRAQNSIQSEAQKLLGADSNWSGDDIASRDCVRHQGWQRAFVWRTKNASAPLTSSTANKIRHLSERADMLPVKTDVVDGKSLRLAFEHPDTEAYLRVIATRDGATVATLSSCALSK
jgi:hypothetical protein